MPAVPLAVWLAAGIWAGLGLAGVIGAGAVAFGLGAGLCLAAAVRPRSMRWGLVLVPVGCMLTLVHLRAPWRTYDQVLPRPACGADIRAVLTGTSYGGDSLDWLSPEPTTVALLRWMRLGPHERWRRVRGSVLLRLPEGRVLAYGASVELSGAFTVPDGGAVHRGGFDYRDYLLNRGIVHVFEVTDVVSVTPVTGWRRLPARLFRWRDHCAEGLTRGMREGPGRDILLAMSLGYRQGLDYDLRRRFLRSGAIHIFAISGLHVGIVGVLLGWVLRVSRLPFRVRCFAVPAVLGLYVILTGGAASSVRAWLMLSIWFVGRGLDRPTVPVNSVALAGLVLLLINPLNLRQVGFLFSFVIVSALVFAWPLLAALGQALFEHRQWVPSGRRRGRWAVGGCQWGVTLAGAGVVTWLAGAGLTAWVNGLFIPASAAVNVGLSGLASASLWLAFPKMLTGMLQVPLLDAGLARVLDALMEGITVLADLGSRHPCSVSVPQRSYGWLPVYYGLLWAALWSRTRCAYRPWCFGVALVVLAAMVAEVPSGEPRVVVINGPSGGPPAVVVAGGRTPPVVVHTGHGETTRALLSWLRAEGHGDVDALVLADPTWNSCGGAAAVVNAVRVRLLVVPPRLRDRSGAGFAALLQRRHRRRVRTLGEPVGQLAADELVLAESGLRLQVFRHQGATRAELVRRQADNPPAVVRLRHDGNGISSVSYRSGAGPWRARLLFPCRGVEILELTAGG